MPGSERLHRELPSLLSGLLAGRWSVPDGGRRAYDQTRWQAWLTSSRSVSLYRNATRLRQARMYIALRRLSRPSDRKKRSEHVIDVTYTYGAIACGVSVSLWVENATRRLHGLPSTVVRIRMYVTRLDGMLDRNECVGSKNSAPFAQGNRVKENNHSFRPCGALPRTPPGLCPGLFFLHPIALTLRPRQLDLTAPSRYAARMGRPFSGGQQQRPAAVLRRRCGRPAHW